MECAVDAFSSGIKLLRSDTVLSKTTMVELNIYPSASQHTQADIPAVGVCG